MPRPGFRWDRIFIAVVITEAIPILLLIAMVALIGPREQAAAQAYAERLGQWVGPLGGAITCFVAAWWVARSLTSGRIRHGFMVGLLAALVDIAILIASGATFQWVFVVSNLGRVVAGMLGAAVYMK